MEETFSRVLPPNDDAYRYWRPMHTASRSFTGSNRRPRSKRGGSRSSSRNTAHGRGVSNDPGDSFARIKSRMKFSDSLKWDGQLTTFRAYRCVVEGHLRQSQTGYLLDPAFAASLRKYGMTYLETQDFVEKYGVNCAQGRADVTYLFGILQSSNRNRNEGILIQYYKDGNGVLAWSEFLKNYNNNGSDEHRADELEEKLSRPYDPALSSFVMYLSAWNTWMIELSTLLHGDGHSDVQKRRILFRCLKNFDILIPFVKYCNDKEFDLESTMRYLRKHAYMIDPSLQKGQASTHMTPQNDVPASSMQLEDARKLYRTTVDTFGVEAAFKAFNSTDYRQGLSIPDDIWKELCSECKGDEGSDLYSTPKVRESCEGMKSPPDGAMCEHSSEGVAKGLPDVGKSLSKSLFDDVARRKISDDDQTADVHRVLSTMTFATCPSDTQAAAPTNQMARDSKIGDALAGAKIGAPRPIRVWHQNSCACGGRTDAYKCYRPEESASGARCGDRGGSCY